MADPKYKPILFQGEMVRAILEGRKTQTRRLVKGEVPESGMSAQDAKDLPREWRPEIDRAAGKTTGDLQFYRWVPHQETFYNPRKKAPWKRGDVLYVRETWWDYGRWHTRKDQTGCVGEREWVSEGHPIRFDADTTQNVITSDYSIHSRWRKMSSLHLPRKYSRIFLEVVDVRVERLQSISPADAIAEGIRLHKPVPGDGETMYYHYLKDKWGPDPIHSYQTLWEKINGQGSWEMNDWVWVVTFKRLDIQNPWDLK